MSEQYDSVGEPVPTDGIQGTPKQYGLKARDVVKYNHTRAFSKTLTPSLYVTIWFSTASSKEKPWNIVYFTRMPNQQGVEVQKQRWCHEIIKYASWEELKKAHPFRFSEFEFDMRYPMEGMPHG